MHNVAVIKCTWCANSLCIKEFFLHIVSLRKNIKLEKYKKGVKNHHVITRKNKINK